jgi:hypothetical protein
LVLILIISAFIVNNTKKKKKKTDPGWWIWLKELWIRYSHCCAAVPQNIWICSDIRIESKRRMHRKSGGADDSLLQTTKRDQVSVLCLDFMCRPDLSDRISRLPTHYSMPQEISIVHLLRKFWLTRRPSWPGSTYA